MPYLSVETSQPLGPSQERAFLERATEWVETRLDKPRAVVMVSIMAGRAMAFAGTRDPAAFVRLKSIGLDAGRCPDLAAELSLFLETELGLSPDRVFIDFQDLDRTLFAWNGKTFA